MTFCNFTVLVKIPEPNTFQLVYRFETVCCIRADGHPGHHIIPTPKGTR